MIKTVNPRMSSAVKYGWNGILSVFLLGPHGLFDHDWCKNSKWITATAAIANGINKFSVKNHVKVALFIVNTLILIVQYPCMGLQNVSL